MVGDPEINLPRALERTARRFPERGIAIFDGRGRRHERRTYDELFRSSLLNAARFRALGVEPGDRVLVGLPSSWDWMDAWLGALMLGAVPAAIAPAGAMGSSEGYGARLERLIERTGARRLVISGTLRDELERVGARQATERAITPDVLAAVTPGTALAPPRTDAAEIAFLQFTSGSTDLPRAVMIPHRAVMHNNLASNEAIGAPHGAPVGDWATSMVSWLPMHHDMGLVGCLFLSINLGLDLWLLNPTTFLARPHLWLQQLARHGPTFSPAPNFGYQLCAERVRGRQLEGLDLSKWRAAMTGAEMVRPETCDAFGELTAGAGFRRESICPCYGLAEGTLAVTFDLRGQGVRTLPVPPGADAGLGLSDVVCVGTPIRNTELRICAPDGSALPTGTIGEVRAKGPSIFAGYYNAPEATAEGLKDGWLCTGDLGFLRDGELYLTGRVKDVLIIRGNNVMPHELEWLAESVAGGGGSQRCGAFSIARGAEGEQAVVVVETTLKDAETIAELDHDIRRRVGRALGMPLADVAFVRRGKIPKTTSGKVQRRALRQEYIDGTLERLES